MQDHTQGHSGSGSEADAQAGRQLLGALHRDLEAPRGVLAGRYELDEPLGHGAHGTVYAARDRLTGERVAVKLLPPAVEQDLVRLRGEIAALRLLRLPGVVHLFDEGVDAGRPFLVMERIDGTPFPGALPTGVERWTWELLRPVALALIETLARVHAAGLVHRDLKPRNVLVTAAGRPMLLDFGLSVGRALSEDSASDTSALGTPAYAAPEQVRGEPVDARADLYALGVMLWEALAGRRPHEAARVSGILRARLAGPVESLARAAPGVPGEVAEVVDALLEVEREGRPRSAVEVGERLRGWPQRAGGWRLPLVGREAALIALVEAARAGQSVCLVGPRGSGRTRLLQEAAAMLEALGRRVGWAQPADRPFESLSLLSAWLEGGEPDSAAEAATATRDALRRALSSGLVLVADDVERLDKWSQRTLAEFGGTGALLVSATDAGCEVPVTGGWVRIGPLEEPDLQRLFTGSDRLRHVHEDAARELVQRTDSLPASLDAELFSWWTAGLVELEAGGLRIQRSAIDRLRGGLQLLPARGVDAPTRPIDDDLDELLAWCHLAWPNTSRELLMAATGRAAWLLDAELDELRRRGGVRFLSDGRVRPLQASRRLAEQSWLDAARSQAHAQLADRIPPGTTGRLYHLIAAGRHAEAVPEACAVAREHRHAGRLSDAEAALGDGLRAAQRAPASQVADLERTVFSEWLAVAISAVTPASSDRLLYEMSRCAGRGPGVAQLERLVRAGLATYGSDGAQALRAIDGVPPLADTELETWRRGLQTRAARRCSLPEHERVLALVRNWAADAGGEQARISLHDWEGLLLYRQARYREAASLHIAGAEAARTTTGRLSALLNAASALLELPALAECAEISGRALVLAQERRHSLFEGRAAWLMRAAGYRSGSRLTPDVELVDAIESLGMLDQTALVALNESAIAYREGQHTLAVRLAQQAARDWIGLGMRDGVLLARALAAAAGGIGPDEGRALHGMALQATLPLAGAQALALLALAGVAPGPEVAPIIRRAAERGRSYGWSVRFEVLSLDEIVAACGLARADVDDSHA